MNITGLTSRTGNTISKTVKVRKPDTNKGTKRPANRSNTISSAPEGFLATTPDPEAEAVDELRKWANTQPKASTPDNSAPANIGGATPMSVGLINAQPSTPEPENIAVAGLTGDNAGEVSGNLVGDTPSNQRNVVVRNR